MTTHFPPATSSHPRWMSLWLLAAAAYNVIWGAAAVWQPALLFEWAGLAPPNYPALWQCIGMIVGVYGVGYAIAATDPLRHWPIVLVGFLGKIFGPIGFLGAVSEGVFNWKFGWTIVTNDLIWWIPFFLILRAALERHLSEPEEIKDPARLARILDGMKTQYGESLTELSSRSPVLLVFLRHAGCTFCRETLGDLAAVRSSIESDGTRIVLVHMSRDEKAEAFFAKYKLEDVDRISDPDRLLYRVFGLRRGRLHQLFGWKVWLRGFEAGILRRHGVGRLQGDGFQMPGIFLLAEGELVRSFRHRTAADRPDYGRFIQCEANSRAGELK